MWRINEIINQIVVVASMSRTTMQAFCQLCTISWRQKTKLDEIKQPRAKTHNKRCLIVRQRNTIPCFCIYLQIISLQNSWGYCCSFRLISASLFLHHRFCRYQANGWCNFTIRTFSSHHISKHLFHNFASHTHHGINRSRDNEWLFIMFAWVGAAVVQSMYF